MPDYTEKQKKEVERILEIDSTDYYTILSVSKGSDTTEIKRSYRKLAMKLHPDKNKHPQAAEAFKKIAKAFEVLGDDNKRKIYDQTGSDPDSHGMPTSSNGAQGPGNGFSSFGGDGSRFFYTNGTPFGSAGGGMFDDDLFDMLFGGANGFGFDMNGFSRGPGNTFFYRANGPGLRRRNRNGNQGGPGQRSNSGFRHRHTTEGGHGAREEDRPHWLSVLYQYLPLLIVLVPMLLNFVVDAFTDGASSLFDRTPNFSFETSPSFPVEKTTPNLGIKYYISKDSLQDLRQKHDGGRLMRRLGTRAEDTYVHSLRDKCQREQNLKERMIEDSYGIFFVDNAKLKKAQQFPTQHCDRLRDLNLL